MNKCRCSNLSCKCTIETEIKCRNIKCPKCKAIMIDMNELEQSIKARKCD